MDWKPKTHKDRLGHNGPVTCACGRITNADMVLDLSGLPPGLVRQLVGADHLGGVPVRRYLDTATLCDGCRERLFQRNPDARRLLFRAMGKP